MAITYKQKCIRCKKNYVTVSRGQRYAICYDCNKSELAGKVKDPKMKKLFDIPEDFYRQNSFLTDIKIKCLKGIELSEKQIEAFKKVAGELKEKN